MEFLLAQLHFTMSQTISDLKTAGTYKQLQYLTGPVASKVSTKSISELILLCSNNYLGLADRPELVKAGIEALQKYGAGAASVRFICGTFDIHQELEKKVAEFLGTESALTYTSCWNANTGVIPTLLSPGDIIISDELNHASIIDGCQLTGRSVKKLVYQHADMTSLEEKLQTAGDTGTKLIITDGVFSMEGDIAPLPAIIKLARKYKALVMVDESHSTGVLGPTGRGTLEHYDLTGQVDIITGTFGKALGGAGGGFIAARKSIIDLCIQRSRPHLFSNSLPPVLSAIALAALQLLESQPELVTSLRQKTDYFKKALRLKGISPLDSSSAIVPIIVGDTAFAIKLAALLLAKGVYAIGFGYPVVPEGKARIRIQLSEALTYQELDFAADVMQDVFATALASD